MKFKKFVKKHFTKPAEKVVKDFKKSKEFKKVENATKNTVKNTLKSFENYLQELTTEIKNTKIEERDIVKITPPLPVVKKAFESIQDSSRLKITIKEHKNEKGQIISYMITDNKKNPICTVLNNLNATIISIQYLKNQERNKLTFKKIDCLAQADTSSDKRTETKDIVFSLKNFPYLTLTLKHTANFNNNLKQVLDYLEDYLQ